MLDFKKKRLEQIYTQFERVIAREWCGANYQNQGVKTKVQLPDDYLVFVESPSRYLLHNWDLYSFYGANVTSLEEVQNEIKNLCVSDRWTLFGKTGDEDFLIFDRESLSGSAVIWCGADYTLSEIQMSAHYAQSFPAFIAKVTRKHAFEQLKLAESVLQFLDKQPAVWRGLE